jgi:hypothetical protein
MIKFVSDLRQVSGFLWVFRFPPPIKLTATKKGNNLNSDELTRENLITIIYITNGLVKLLTMNSFLEAFEGVPGCKPKTLVLGFWSNVNDLNHSATEASCQKIWDVKYLREGLQN